MKTKHFPCYNLQQQNCKEVFSPELSEALEHVHEGRLAGQRHMHFRLDRVEEEQIKARAAAKEAAAPAPEASFFGFFGAAAAPEAADEARHSSGAPRSSWARSSHPARSAKREPANGLEAMARNSGKAAPLPPGFLSKLFKYSIDLGANSGRQPARAA